MAVFKKTYSLDGKYKAVQIVDGNIIDVDSGEMIDIISVFASIYGENVFSISTSSKASEEIEA